MGPSESDQPSRLSRRTLLGAAGATAALSSLTWTPAFRVTPAEAATAAPPSFPSGISVYQQAWSNWSGEIVLSPQWTCAPATPADVAAKASSQNHPVESAKPDAASR